MIIVYIILGLMAVCSVFIAGYMIGNDDISDDTYQDGWFNGYTAGWYDGIESTSFRIDNHKEDSKRG